MTSEALYATFGRLHLAVLHFPVALLALAALLELLELRAPDERRAALVRTLARFGAVGALAAALTGWVHADAEPLGRTVAETLDLHRWTGIASAVFALVAGWGSGLARRAGLFAAALSVSVAGHFGGELVHGEGYLTELLTRTATAPQEPSTPSVPPSASPTFERDVLPLMQALCVECHGPLKRGDSAASELVRRMRLPLDDEDHMPPSKEAQPAAADVDLVARWIDAGAR
ncbi:MAG: hypothetical protein NTV21_14305 [Planctomycetota bacterium]|nr:hypothetical protein [Planctomycetota bacterium]